jgi:RES domain-containing protein
MVARARLGAADFLPRRFYRYQVGLQSLLDVRAPGALAALELSEAELTGDDPSACQSVGDAAHYLGREGVVAPSATGSGVVLAVFFDRLQADSFIRDLDFEEWSAAPE